MIHCSLQAEFEETKHNGHIHGIQPLSLVTLLFMYLNRLTMIIKLFGAMNAFWLDMPSVLFTSKAGLFYFCCIPCIIDTCMEEVWVGVVYNTLVDSNEGDLSPYTSQTVYFYNINENKISYKTYTWKTEEWLTFIRIVYIYIYMTWNL